MTRFIVLLPALLVWLSTTVLAQQKITVFGYTYHSINDTLYAGEWEVSNLEYRNFLTALPAAEREKCKSDSSLWLAPTNGISYNEPFTRNYHWHPAFDSYPVVNIEHAHAIKYCEWLTALYNIKKKKSEWTFRLPTIDEWLLLADPDPQTNLPFGISNGQNKEGCYIINVNPEGKFASDGAHYTTGKSRSQFVIKQEYYYTRSKLGLFHITGNVAEMTTNDGIQKGGSWNEDPEACYVKDVQQYSTPDPRVGFRVVAIKGERAEKVKRQKR